MKLGMGDGMKSGMGDEVRNEGMGRGMRLRMGMEMEGVELEWCYVAQSVH